MRAKHFLSLILVLAINVLAFGQKGEKLSPEEKAKKMTEKMADKLELNPEQKKAVYEVNLKMVQERIAQKEKAKASKKTYRDSLEGILDEAQKAKLKNKKERGRKHKAKCKEKCKRSHHKRKKEKEDVGEEVEEETTD